MKSTLRMVVVALAAGFAGALARDGAACGEGTHGAATPDVRLLSSDSVIEERFVRIESEIARVRLIAEDASRRGSDTAKLGAGAPSIALAEAEAEAEADADRSARVEDALLMARFDAEAFAPNWAPTMQGALERELSSADAPGQDGGRLFGFGRPSCKATSCVVEIDWSTLATAEATQQGIVERVAIPGCIGALPLVRPVDPGPFSSHLFLTCERR